MSVDEAVRRELESFVDRHGYFEWLGLEFGAVDEGRVTMTVPDAPKLRNPGGGSVHGGVAATLVDTASGFALRTTFDDPSSARLTTTDLDVKYLRPATDDLRVEARVRRAGRSVGVTDAVVTSTHPDGGEVEVAAGSTTYRLFRDGDGGGRDDAPADDPGGE